MSEDRGVLLWSIREHTILVLTPPNGQAITVHLAHGRGYLTCRIRSKTSRYSRNRLYPTRQARIPTPFGLIRLICKKEGSRLLIVVDAPRSIRIDVRRGEVPHERTEATRRPKLRAPR